MNIKALLTKKIGPLPAFVYPIIAVGGYVVYRKVSGGGSTSPTSQAAGTDQLGGSSGEYYDAYGNLYDSNGNLIQAAQTPQDQTGAVTPVDTSGAGAGVPPVDSSGGNAPIPPTLDQSYLDSIDAAYLAGAAAGSGALGGTYLGTAPSEGNASQAIHPGVAVVSRPLISVPEPSPVNAGISSSKKLLNGATLTTLAGGRQIEQAPGKTAYVVKAGTGARKTYTPPVSRPKPAPKPAKKTPKKPVVGGMGHVT